MNHNNQQILPAPTTDQKKVLDQVESFLTNDNDIFILHGYAGTGKTTLIKWICDKLLMTLTHDKNTKSDSKNKPYAVLTPTGRAAKVLRTKGIDAYTIHSVIYSNEILCLEVENEDVSKKKYELLFPLKEIPENTRVIIIDESSMIGDTAINNEMFKFGTGRLLTDLLIYRSVALNNIFDKSLFIKNDEKRDLLSEYIRNYYKTHESHTGCKLIFVGDDAQLPPIGESHSKALDANYFTNLGLKVEEAFLTEVIRQKNDSGILQASIDIRNLLSIPIKERTDLRIEENDDDIIEIAATDVVTKYLDLFPQPNVGNSVIVCYSNKRCLEFNTAIRKHYYPTLINTNNTGDIFADTIDVQVGDILICHKNSHSERMMKVYNGDMCVVTNVGERKTHWKIPVTIKNANKRYVDLHFRKVDLLFPDHTDHNTISTLIIENLLYSPERALTIWESLALYIDFCMRIKDKYPMIKDGSEEFKTLLKSDEYMNALQMKFGYAITCHKAQGGEWKNVIVDYSKQCGLADYQLKWCYTATTRAKHTLYAVNPPKINGLTKLQFLQITTISKTPAHYFNQDMIISNQHCPFHKPEAPLGAKLKYLGISNSVQHSEFKIENVKCSNYMDEYTFSKNGSILPAMKLYYDKEGVFKPVIADGNDDQVALAQIINGALCLPESINYVPSSKTLASLYQLMCSACEQVDITITNVDEQIDHFFVVYNLKTDAKCACIQFYISGDKLTKAMPKSDMGDNDKKLSQLVNILQVTYNQ